MENGTRSIGRKIAKRRKIIWCQLSVISGLASRPGLGQAA